MAVQSYLQIQLLHDESHSHSSGPVTNDNNVLLLHNKILQNTKFAKYKDKLEKSIEESKAKVSHCVHDSSNKHRNKYKLIFLFNNS